MQDWAREARHGRYQLRGDPVDYEAALSRLRVLSLMEALEGESMIPGRRGGAPGTTGQGPRRAAYRSRRGSEPAGRVRPLQWAWRESDVVVDHLERWLVEQTG